jgi:hypothetical protein
MELFSGARNYISETKCPTLLERVLQAYLISAAFFAVFVGYRTTKLHGGGLCDRRGTTRAKC